MKYLKLIIFITSLIALICIAVLTYHYVFITPSEQTIKFGILHSLTGPLAYYEKPIVDATMLAIEEINNKRGVLGKKIIPIIRDGKSESSQFAKEAKDLITHEKVAVLFGCSTAQDRKTIRPIVEKYNSLLFYPVQSEGLEDSPNIIYTSTIPNQQAIPAATWCLENLGTAFFLVGSDELFPRATHEILKGTILLFDGTIVAEEYIKPDTNMKDIIQKIITTQPQVIINTIIGDKNLTFYKELRAAGITSEKIPTMSLCIDESELEKYGADYMAGDYSCWSHFQSIERIENKIFVDKIHKKYGIPVSDSMEAAYYGVYLWAHAVTKAKTVNTTDVLVAIRNQAFDAPEGIVHVDDISTHTWSVASIGKIRSDKQFTLLWNSIRAIRPMIYPFFKSRQEWDELLEQWYKQWGNKWLESY